MENEFKGIRSRKNITLDVIKYYLIFNKETGKFYRNVDHPRSKKMDDGSVFLIKKGERYLCNLNLITVDILWLAWFYINHKAPPKRYYVYPKNGDFTDGREDNIYLDIGTFNHPVQRKVKSLPKGVVKVGNKYRTYYKHSEVSKQFYLGTFNTPEEASEHYQSKVKELIETGSAYITIRGKTRLLTSQYKMQR